MIASTWPTPDWPSWLAADSVTIEEAVALSLNRSPKQLSQKRWSRPVWTPVADLYDPGRPWPEGDQRYEAASRGDKVPIQTEGVMWEFPAVGHPEGNMRLGEVRTAILRGDGRLPTQPGQGVRIRLQDFARYAADHDWDVPPRIAALVAQARQDAHSEPIRLVSPRSLGEKWTNEHRAELMRQHKALSDRGHKFAQADEMIAEAWNTSPSSIKQQRLASKKGV